MYSTQWVSRYVTKQSHGEAVVLLGLWRMWNTSLLPSLPVPLWSGEVAPDSVLFKGRIVLNCVPILNWIVWN